MSFPHVISEVTSAPALEATAAAKVTVTGVAVEAQPVPVQVRMI